MHLIVLLNKSCSVVRCRCDWNEVSSSNPQVLLGGNRRFDVLTSSSRQLFLALTFRLHTISFASMLSEDVKDRDDRCVVEAVSLRPATLSSIEYGLQICPQCFVLLFQIELCDWLSLPGNSALPRNSLLNYGISYRFGRGIP
jgi:hypothetical protein